MSEVIDFMSIGREAGGHTEQTSRQVVHIARAIRGPVRFRMECRPAFDYARESHDVHLAPDAKSAVFARSVYQFVLNGGQPLRRNGSGGIAEFEMRGGEARFVLRHGAGRTSPSLAEETVDSNSLLNKTVRYWRSWAPRSRYHGRWGEMEAPAKVPPRTPQTRRNYPLTPSYTEI